MTKTTLGGARKGAGRPKGSVNAGTLKKQEAERMLKMRITDNVEELLNRLLLLSMGVSYLYKIPVDKKGKRGKAELIKDTETIEKYLNGQLKGEDDYYYISTEKPDLRAIQDMLDRVFGKPKQSIGLEGDIDHTLTVNIIDSFEELIPDEPNNTA